MRFGKILAKRTLAAALALALGVTSVVTVPTNAEAAAGDETILLSEEGTNYSDEVYYSCDVSEDSHVYVEMNVSSKAEFDVDIYSSTSSSYWKAWAEEDCYTTHIKYEGGTSVKTGEEWQQSAVNSGWYLLSFDFIVSAGDTLDIELCFYDGVSYALTVKGVEIESAEDAIVNENTIPSDYVFTTEDALADYKGLVSEDDYDTLYDAQDDIATVLPAKITIGYSYTSVTKGYENTEVTWTSSDTNIATVSKKGVITGVSIGNVTISASVKVSSYTMMCSREITICKNEYTEKKMTLKDCVKGSSTVNVYSVSCTSSGDLKIKVRVLNRKNKAFKIMKNSLHISARDAGVGVFASYTGKAAIKVKAKSCKDFTITIKKSKLIRNGTYNLGSAVVEVSWDD